MKRKIFSKLLMGAFLFASVSAFVSCKDYDDDINANKADIKAAQEQLATLTSSLSSLQQKLETEKTALQQELASTKSQLETQIANAKAELNSAIATKADQATVDGLIKRISDLETDLAAAKEAYNAKIEALDKALESLKTIVEKKADQTYVDQAIATLTAAISGKVSTEDFNAFKGEVAKIETNLTNLITLVNTKADKATVDAQIAAINKDIENLQKSFDAALAQQKTEFEAATAQLQSKIDAKADKAALDLLNEKLTTLANSFAALQEAINAKADKATVEALDQKTSEALAKLDEQVKKLVTPEQLQEKVTYLENLIDKKANQSEFADLKEKFAALRAEFDRHNENISLAIADAIYLLDQKLTAIIDTKVDQTEFDETVEGIEAEIDEVEDSIADILLTLVAVDGDITAIYALIDELKENTGNALDALDEKINNNSIAIVALALQAAAVQEFLADFEDEDGALNVSLKDLFDKASEDLQNEITKQNKAREEAIAEIGELIAGVRSDLQEDIDANAEDIEQLKADFAKISDIIDARIAENINNLAVFVSKSLKSISLVPQLFIGGIEAIEFTSLQYTPMKPGTSGLGADKHNQYVANAKAVTIDDGTAEAYYRLNPSIIERESIDEENIEFLAATAKTRAATVESPVAFNGIAEWNYGGKKGLVKVNLKKTITGSLNLPEPNIYIVALKVPRKEQTIAGEKIEAADIVSENSRLVEKVRTPRIAKLPWKGRDGRNGVEYLAWRNGNNQHVGPLQAAVAGQQAVVDGPLYNTHHFTDSVTMYAQHVDENELVYAEVNFNEPFDVSKIVTACDIETPKDAATCAGIDDANYAGYYEVHEQNAHQITVEQLKKYGLEFRYAIAEKEYKNDVDHATDQQKFATVDPVTGIVTSLVPQVDGTSIVDNRACVGKEPIIRIELIDTKNGNIVDQRYMKIKWVEPTKGTKELGDFEIETTLKPCETNGKVGVTWLWFIDKAYSKAEITGMSQATFKQVYMTKEPTVGDVTYVPNSHLSLLSEALTPGKPVVEQTTNEQGDALIATWELEPAEIANIYPSQSKTFTAKITFHSILETEYPNLTMNFKWTIKLPSLPSINGYYDNYWFNKYAEHYVLPVQYNTDQYRLIANRQIVPGRWYGVDAPAVGMQIYNRANNTVARNTDYCVFYNSITNPFSYELKKNTQDQDVPQFIVKNLLGECSTWDMQFTMTGKDAIEALGTWDAANAKWSKVNGATNKVYAQYEGYRPASNTNSPSLNKINWQTAGAYKLETTAGAQALQLEWWGQAQDFHTTGIYAQNDRNHVAWDNINTNWGGKLYNYAVLYADHHNAANQALLNTITPKGIGVAPDYSHTKGIQMGIWGTLNDWNIIPVKDYKFYMVEPLAINAELDGAFEEGIASGTAVRCDDAFEMTDFRGYEVKNTAATILDGSADDEFRKYRWNLWRYYEVENPVWNLEDVKYGLKVVTEDNELKIKSDNTNKMTAAEISRLTNGNIRLSITQKRWQGVDYLVFKNNGGSNVEEEVWVYIPVKAKYGFGEVTKEAKVRLYPNGKVPEDKTIIYYPGNN